ncbi:3-ketoacyl-ACP reductase [Dactylosporangium sp. CA-092794]|uniref:3-ketoacyl-ACP reductase n=1 Tax=Dactylosporangium sp. CA-092794 TaxID=3239929 RepID=UPI003D92A3CF
MSAALVTGASRGIGRGIALALARSGFDIVVNYASNAEAAASVAASVREIGTKAAMVRADVARSEDRTRLVEEAYDAFGDIELLVNNAGVAPAVRADILEAGEESFDRLIAINLKGPYFLTQLVANRMIAAGTRGRIVTISSMSAYTASVNRGDYCITKAGLSMLTKLYAARLAEHGITVFEVRPGIIATDMTDGVKEKYDRLIHDDGITPIRRWGTPDDVGRAVVAIATDLLPFSTAQVIDVDGGFHLHTL